VVANENTQTDIHYTYKYTNIQISTNIRTPSCILTITQ